MSIIEFFIESHWEIERPNLSFYLNDLKLDNGHCLLYEKVNKNTEYLIYKFITDVKFVNHNYIKIKLSKKTDELVTKDCDHWVEIKNIFLDGIGADWLLYNKTKFRHDMPSEWIEDMKNQNIEIPKEFCPGTVMRLNGVMEFYFEQPFWLFKTKEIENS